MMGLGVNHVEVLNVAEKFQDMHNFKVREVLDLAIMHVKWAKCKVEIA